MANYVSKTRTNYFKVSDLAALKQLLAETAADEGGTITLCDRKDENTGETRYMFYVESSILGIPELTESADDADLNKVGKDVDSSKIDKNINPDEIDEDDEDENEEPEQVYDYDEFTRRLSEIVAPGDAIIITEVGSEKVRYLSGYATVVTRNAVKEISLSTQAQILAKQMLGNSDWTTEMEY